MTDLRESWARTTAHLSRAAELSTGQDLSQFREYLEHNELQLAADVLTELADEHGQLPRAFWEALQYAYENMGLEKNAKVCRFRMYEAEHGFVEARLSLLPASAGGRSNPIFTDYRPDWNIGNRTDPGELELNGARVSLEDCEHIEPGGSDVVRLHPTLPEEWGHLQRGAEINMHEGSRVVGKAVVTRVALRREPSS
ncbi:MAG: hypothetical protein HY898_35045 [Deltaproteobacteria bacterium]|nr:hypothetical protein [Deltaproteobacteria bacterium]